MAATADMGGVLTHEIVLGKHKSIDVERHPMDRLTQIVYRENGQQLAAIWLTPHNLDSLRAALSTEQGI